MRLLRSWPNFDALLVGLIEYGKKNVRNWLSWFKARSLAIGVGQRTVGGRRTRIQISDRIDKDLGRCEHKDAIIGDWWAGRVHKGDRRSASFRAHRYRRPLAQRPADCAA